MQKLFAVIRTRGPAWQDSRTSDVLLIVRATTPDEVRYRLAEDPWASKGLLRVSRVAPWTLRLGALA
jgi:hypothetical protein